MTKLESVEDKIREKFETRKKLAVADLKNKGETAHLPVEIRLFKAIFTAQEWLEVGTGAMMRIIDDAASGLGLVPQIYEGGNTVWGYDLPEAEKESLIHPESPPKPKIKYQLPTPVKRPPGTGLPRATKHSRPAPDSDRNSRGVEPNYKLDDA